MHQIQSGKHGKLTAERLYRKFIASKIRDAEVARLQRIFAFDEHFIWYAQSSEDQESKHRAVLEYMNEAVYPNKVIAVNHFTVQGVANHVIKSL